MKDDMDTFCVNKISLRIPAIGGTNFLNRKQWQI